MSFTGITSLFAFSLLAAAAVVLLILHFLNEKNTRITVPTNLFWQSVSSKTKSSVIFGKLRHWRSFILLLMVIIFLILSLMEPVFSTDHQNYLFIIDCRSFPGDDTASSLEQAKTLSLDLLSDLPADAGIAIIAIEETASIALTSGEDPATATIAVHKLKPANSYSSLALEQALAMADAITKSGEWHVQMFVNSDCRPLISDADREHYSIYSPSSDGMHNSNDADTAIPTKKHKVYLNGKVPVMLAEFYRNNQYWTVVDNEKQADMFICYNSTTCRHTTSVIEVKKTAGKTVKLGKIVASDYLTAMVSDSISITRDLFAGTGSGLTVIGDNNRVLLHTPDNKILAYLDLTGKVIVSEALFADDASFWKQPQFIELMTVFSSLAQNCSLRFSPDKPEHYSQYENQYRSKELLDINSSFLHKTGLTRIALFLSLTGLLVEFVLYCRRVIV